jgi:CRISPR-associated endonuclease/helicase Cas3
LDSIVQVAGRCNRHGIRPRAEVRVVRLKDDRQRYCDYIYDPTLLDETGASLRHGAFEEDMAEIDEEDMAEIVEDYFRRLHKRKDVGLATTAKWSRFEHDDLRVSRLLRGDQEQVSFVVGKLDPALREDVEGALNLPDRWVRRRELRGLAPRIASVTVSAWKTPKYVPSDIADPVPAWSESPIFWFLHDDAYNEEVGLCPPKAMSQLLF